MENLALYRKYRPKDFAEVRGQEHIVSVLESSIASGDPAHAYLFVGSRGTGKTTLARILAGELGVSVNDIYEIDAASNRGIDDIRELRDGVRVLPFDSKYKIYIIDEVHMLTKEAWAALLKTLEEPPAHVIFILATTELRKVPDTIISRCQVFNFRKPSEGLLKEVIEDVAAKEGYKLEEGVAELLALLADGSFRDALGGLQKVFTLGGGKNKNIKKAAVEEITGSPKSVLINDFLSAIANADLEAGLRTIRQGNAENIDIKLFLKLVIVKFRMALVLRYAPKLTAEYSSDFSESDLEFLKSLLSSDKKGLLRSGTLATLLEAYANLDNAFIPELPIELALVKILEEEK